MGLLGVTHHEVVCSTRCPLYGQDLVGPLYVDQVKKKEQVTSLDVYFFSRELVSMLL